MANYCSINGTITLKNSQEAEHLCTCIEEALDSASGYLDFGGEAGLLESNFHVDDNVIRCSFDVKWALDQEDMAQFVRWLGQYVPVANMVIDLRYEELGCMVIGRYELHDCVLTDYFVPENEFPPYPEIKDNDDKDEIFDSYMNELYELVELAEGETVCDFHEKCA